MNRKRFAELASQAQAGDKTSLEHLLLLAYTPVSYQCRKLLQNDQAVEAMTREILRRIPSRLNTLDHPEEFENWLSNLTAKHCMQKLQQQPAEKDTPPKKLHVPCDHLDERETAMVVDQIVDALPDALRICFTLYCCKIPRSGIAKLTGFAESDVNTHLSRAQALINGQLQKLSQHGVRFAAANSLPELLRIAMYTPKNPKSAASVVRSILGKPAATPVPVPRKTGTAPALKIAVAVVSALLVLMLGLIFFLERNRQAELETEATTVATEVTTLPTETTVSTTVIETTTETTIETTAETTQETVVETTSETTEATTEPATVPASQEQQAQGSPSASGGGNAASSAGSNTSSATGSNTASNTGANASSAAGGNHVHSYQDAGPIGVTPAGCESPGSRLKISFVCGDQVRYTDAAGLPPLGHNYSSTVKPPTTGREGFTIHTCTRCGLTYMDNYVPKLPEETQATPQPEAEPDES